MPTPVPKRKLSKLQLGLLYMRDYEAKMNASHNAICEANEKNPDKKIYSRDEFWQIFNKYWNIKQYEAMLLHLKMNYLNGYNRGKF